MRLVIASPGGTTMDFQCPIPGLDEEQMEEAGVGLAEADPQLIVMWEP